MSSCAICGKEIHEQFPAKCLSCHVELCDDCALSNQFKCNTCNPKKQLKKVESVRRSYIELYKKCPHAFKLKVIDGVQTNSSIYAKIGIFLHDLFDNASMTCIFNKSEMIKSWDAFFITIELKEFEGCQRLLTTEEFQKQQYQKGLLNIDGFIEMCQGKYKPWKTEETVNIIIPNTDIKATMTFDRIDKHDDGYELLDYKTGKVYTGQKLSTDLQPALYIAGVEQTYGINIDKFTFLFTGESKLRTYIKTDKGYETTVGKKSYGFNIKDKLNEVSEIFKRIERNEFEIPSDLHPWHCQNECELYKALACPGKFYEEWKGN
jgi:hypothetical protein